MTSQDFGVCFVVGQYGVLEQLRISQFEKAFQYFLDSYPRGLCATAQQTVS